MDDLQKQIDTSSNNYNKLVQIERHERKKTTEIEQQLEEQKQKVKQQRNKLNFNQMKLNDLETAFQVQKQRTQLVIDAVQYHDISEENESSDGNIDKDDDGPKQSDLTTNTLESYESSCIWLKKNFQINDVKTTAGFAQTPMALLITKRIDDDDRAYQTSGGDDDTSMLNETKTLEVNLHHPLIKDLFYRIDYLKDDKTTFDFAYVMIDIAALRLGHSLENPTDFADRIESILKQAMKISLDEQVEDESNDDRNLIDDHINSKRITTATEIDYDGKDQ